ncbi:plasmolipin isoform X2 [Nematostella vectensis]|uniref:plasmolipin isoform X2 n=1 Tax=Nematostella vectensis TaxID=45351 RepID=UPI002076DEA5|nr:plasmolipin isoform X2 [Nematostella vectensis]
MNEEDPVQPEDIPNNEKQENKRSQGAVTINVGYLKSFQGVLKFVEIVLLLLAFACTSSGTPFNNLLRNYDFFMFTTVFPWILCIIIIILYLFCLVDKVPQINWNLTVLINAVIWFILIIISSSLLARDIGNLEDLIVKIEVPARIKAFGFFSCFAFIGDAVIHFLVIRG